MKKMCVLLPLAIVVPLGMAILAQAGGNGAVQTNLEVGEILGPTHTEVVGPPVGKVIFSPTASGMMNVTVQVKDGEPDTTFECYVVPPAQWPPDGDRTTLTLNKQGKGTAHLQVEMADPAYWIKVVVINRDLEIAYVTERITDFME